MLWINLNNVWNVWNVSSIWLSIWLSHKCNSRANGERFYHRFSLHEHVHIIKKLLEYVKKWGSSMRWEIGVALQFLIRGNVTQLLIFFMCILGFYLYVFISNMHCKMHLKNYKNNWRGGWMLCRSVVTMLDSMIQAKSWNSSTNIDFKLYVIL